MSSSTLHSRQEGLTASHIILGELGEQIGVRFLQGIGYTILARNVRLGRDEIDIIAWDPEDSVIVFVEVKSRAIVSNTFHPRLNATHVKKSRMIRAARRWVADHAWDGGYRLDLVFVARGKVIQHVQECGIPNRFNQ